jgi:hypothetical protein
MGGMAMQEMASMRQMSAQCEELHAQTANMMGGSMMGGQNMMGGSMTSGAGQAGVGAHETHHANG